MIDIGTHDFLAKSLSSIGVIFPTCFISLTHKWYQFIRENIEIFWCDWTIFIQI